MVIRPATPQTATPSRLAALVLLSLGAAGCLDGGRDPAAADASGDAADAVARPDTGLVPDATEPADAAAPDGGPEDAASPDAITALVRGAGRCGRFDALAPCQGDAACAQFGNCCADYEAACGIVNNVDDFLFAQGGECADPSSWFAVTRVRDGDTVDLEGGEAVRFLLVDTPEVTSDDCMAWEAKAFTQAAVAQSGGEVCLVTDPTSEDRDLYDRLLRYVYVRDQTQAAGPYNLNVRLLRLGQGRLLYPYAFGRLYEEVGKGMQAAAAAEDQGGWGTCGW